MPASGSVCLANSRGQEALRVIITPGVERFEYFRPLERLAYGKGSAPAPDGRTEAVRHLLPAGHRLVGRPGLTRSSALIRRDDTAPDDIRGAGGRRPGSASTRTPTGKAPRLSATEPTHARTHPRRPDAARSRPVTRSETHASRPARTLSHPNSYEVATRNGLDVHRGRAVPSGLCCARVGSVSGEATEGQSRLLRKRRGYERDPGTAGSTTVSGRSAAFSHAARWRSRPDCPERMVTAPFATLTDSAGAGRRIEWRKDSHGAAAVGRGGRPG